MEGGGLHWFVYVGYLAIRGQMQPFLSSDCADWALFQSSGPRQKQVFTLQELRNEVSKTIK